MILNYRWEMGPRVLKWLFRQVQESNIETSGNTRFSLHVCRLSLCSPCHSHPSSPPCGTIQDSARLFQLEPELASELFFLCWIDWDLLPICPKYIETVLPHLLCFVPWSKKASYKKLKIIVHLQAKKKPLSLIQLSKWNQLLLSVWIRGRWVFGSTLATLGVPGFIMGYPWLLLSPARLVDFYYLSSKS